MLSIKNLRIDAAHYGWHGFNAWKPIIHNVSLDVAPGQVVALLGSSGEGKSLILQSILGVLPDNLRASGRVLIDHQEHYLERAQAISHAYFCYLPQGVHALNPLLNIEQLLQRAYSLAHKKWDLHQVYHLLKANDLPPSILAKYPHQISAGMAKRVFLCHALIKQSPYILADEITTWLDEALAHQTLVKLRHLADEGRGVLWVTHDLKMASMYSDRIIFIHHGQLMDNISTAQFSHGDMSEELNKQSQALPEKSAVFL